VSLPPGHLFVRGKKMKLYQFDIPKSKLCSMPKKKRIFFVQIMNFMNEMHTLQKLSVFAGNSTDLTNDVVKSAQVSQALLLAKILALKLCEGWKLIKRELLDKSLNLPAEIQQDFEKITADGFGSIEEGLKSLDKLKAYLEQPIPANRIKLIRDQFAAHYSKQASKKIGQLIEKAPQTKIYSLFLSEAYGNCFYKISHDLSDEAMLEQIGTTESQDDTKPPMTAFMEDVQHVVSSFLNFIGSYIMVVIIKNFGFEEHTEVEIPEPPDLNEVTVPYFVKGEMSKAKSK
jgi:hypothetical protein